VLKHGPAHSLTEAACHWPLRGVETPRALRASAMSLRVVAPALRTSRITGSTLERSAVAVVTNTVRRNSRAKQGQEDRNEIT
jgi:hypothetical protein